MSQVLTVSCLFLFAILGMIGIATADGDKPPFRITTKRESDKVDVEVEKSNARISFHSPLGISQAVVERNGENWPGRVTLSLHLKGLENFKVTNGKVTVNAAVSSHNNTQSVRLWQDDKEGVPLNSKSPFWMKIRILGDDGNRAQTIPLVNGRFEMRLPKALFKENPKSITVSWIDFYR